MNIHKKNIVFLQNIIFNKDIVWDGSLIAYFDDDIKQLDEAIVYNKIFKSKLKKSENIHLVKKIKVGKPIPKVIRQANYKD